MVLGRHSSIVLLTKQRHGWLLVTLWRERERERTRQPCMKVCSFRKPIAIQLYLLQELCIYYVLHTHWAGAMHTTIKISPFKGTPCERIIMIYTRQSTLPRPSCPPESLVLSHCWLFLLATARPRSHCGTLLALREKAFASET